MQIMHVSSMIHLEVSACSMAQRTPVVTQERWHNLNLSLFGCCSKLVFVRSGDTLDWKMISMLNLLVFSVYVDSSEGFGSREAYVIQLDLGDVPGSGRHPELVQ